MSRRKAGITTQGDQSAGQWRRVPSSDIVNNWAQGAGDDDGDAFDELLVRDQEGWWDTVDANQDVLEMAMNNITTAPTDDTSVTINIVLRTDDGAGSVRIRIIETATERATYTRSLTFGPTWNNYSINLNLSAVVSWADMRIEIKNESSADGTIHCSWAEFIDGP